MAPQYMAGIREWRTYRVQLFLNQGFQILTIFEVGNRNAHFRILNGHLQKSKLPTSTLADYATDLSNL